MKHIPDRIGSYLLMLLAWCITLNACNSTKKITKVVPRQSKALVGSSERGWLHYEVFLLPVDSGIDKKNDVVKLSVRIVNKHDNTSPLRKLCNNLDDYNTLYEYLLNSARNEIYLQTSGAITYPVSYSFENNYNAFPFETINVGYHIRPKKKAMQLVYVDRVFARDTLIIPLNL